VEELILLGNGAVLSGIEEDLGELSAGLVTEVGDCELSGIDLLLEGGAGHLGGGRAHLLEDPVDDIVLGSATVVLHLLTLPI